jgi:hypothetical protein
LLGLLPDDPQLAAGLPGVKLTYNALGAVYGLLESGRFSASRKLAADPGLWTKNGVTEGNRSDLGVRWILSGKPRKYSTLEVGRTPERITSG